MRIKLSIFLLAAALAAAARAASPATQPATRPTAGQLTALIRSLSSDDWQIRQDAQDALVALADDAQRSLQQVAADESADSEVRARAERAIRQIELNRRVGPTLVTLNLANVPARQAFEAVIARAAECGVRLEPAADLWSQPLPAVTLNVDRRPLWDVLRELALQTQVGPQLTGGSRITLDRGEQNALAAPSKVTGPVLTSAVSIRRTAISYPAAKLGVQRSVVVRLVAMFEPKLRSADNGRGYEMSRFRLLEATDDKGNSLSHNSMYVQPERNGWCWTINLPLQGTDGATRIRRLRAELRVDVETHAGSIEFNAADTDEPIRQLAGRRYQFVSLTRNDDTHFTLRVRAFRDDRTEEEWADLPNTLQQSGRQIDLLDASGAPWTFRRTGTVQYDQAAAYVQADYQFERAVEKNGSALPGEPAKISWRVTLDTVPMVVPFDLSDLPLP